MLALLLFVNDLGRPVKYGSFTISASDGDHPGWLGDRYA